MVVTSKDDPSSPKPGTKAAGDKSDMKKASIDKETNQENIAQVGYFPVKFEY